MENKTTMSHHFKKTAIVTIGIYYHYLLRTVRAQELGWAVTLA
jgi:hypothetical protein